MVKRGYEGIVVGVGMLLAALAIIGVLKVIFR